jgi:hypothetical protein
VDGISYFVQTAEAITLKEKCYHPRKRRRRSHQFPRACTVYQSMALQSFCWTLTTFFSFLILYTAGRAPWTGDQPVARPLPTHRISAHTDTIDQRWSRCWGRWRPSPTIYIHTYRHPCLELHSNRQSQRSSKRRQFMPFRSRGHCDRRVCVLLCLVISSA